MCKQTKMWKQTIEICKKHHNFNSIIKAFYKTEFVLKMKLVKSPHLKSLKLLCLQNKQKMNHDTMTTNIIVNFIKIHFSCLMN